MFGTDSKQNAKPLTISELQIIAEAGQATFGTSRRRHFLVPHMS